MWESGKKTSAYYFKLLDMEGSKAAERSNRNKKLKFAIGYL
jgi:hypothetical protein